VAADIRAGVLANLPRLRRFVLGLTGDRDRADDIVQETCARALANAGQWREGTRLDSWMYRIAQNIWLDHKRAQRVRGEVVDVDEQVNLVGSDGRSLMEDRQMLMAVSRALSEMSPDQQLVVALICFDGLSYKDAAVTLDLPIGTVMSRLARARITLAKALGERTESASTPRQGGHHG
jgi:RNA polymerase sigma-70 factor, ECF subfamily